MDTEFSRDWIILESVVGSHAYGISTPNSDTDIKGVAIPPIVQYLGFETPWSGTSSKVGNVERTYYAIRQFFVQCCNASPESLDILFSPEVLHNTTAGDWLLSIRNQFLSTKVRHSYAGFAYSQLKQVRAAPDKPNSGKKAAHAIRLMRMAKEIMLTGIVNTDRRGIDAEELIDLRTNWTASRLGDLESFMQKSDSELTEIYDSGSNVLPHKPDRNHLNNQLIAKLKARLECGL